MACAALKAITTSGSNLLPALGAVCCVGLLIHKAVDDITVYGYAAGLLALGAVLWGINRMVGGPHREIDPAKRVD